MIRVPNLTDLSDSHQVRELKATLTAVRRDLSRTAMPVEEARPADKPESTRFRVVAREVPPQDASFDKERQFEVHFFVGGRWMRVMLEDL